LVLDAITGSKKTTLADAVVVLWWLLGVQLIGADVTERFYSTRGADAVRCMSMRLQSHQELHFN
jgi:hypothetical protein